LTAVSPSNLPLEDAVCECCLQTSALAGATPATATTLNAAATAAARTIERMIELPKYY
jgi:hypothetical protein